MPGIININYSEAVIMPPKMPPMVNIGMKVIENFLGDSWVGRGAVPVFAVGGCV